MKKVGILGATGTVGQRFITLLECHPHFEIFCLGASSNSAGKSYKEATSWKMTTSIPSSIANMVVLECMPELFKGCDLVFSGLDASVAGEIETAFMADFPVFSNAKNHRMNEHVPLVVPLTNPSHLNMIPTQKLILKTNGFLVTNANCSTTGLSVVLKALQDAFGPLEKVMVTTMQAISGAGYPGVPSLDILGNVVPYISGEEEKIESELVKILGTVKDDLTGFIGMPIKVSASCNRVAVIDGHTESVFIEFKAKPAPSIQAIQEALEEFVSEPQKLKTFSAPKHAIVIKQEPDRPQPRLDIDVESGNCVVVGRVRTCPVFDVKLSLLCHNTILGAAGSSIMNAEICLAKGFF